MATATLPLPTESTTLQRDNPELHRTSVVTLAEAKALKVTDAVSYQRADVVRGALSSGRKAIWDWFSPMADAANKLHKTITGRRGEAVDPLDAEYKRLGAEMADWKSEQDRLQRQAELEAQARAKKEQEAIALAEAAALEQAGQTDLAQAVVEQALTAPAPTIALTPSVPKLANTTYVKEWRYRVLNLALVPREYLCLDEKKVGAYADAMQEGAKVPGIEFYSVDVPRGKGGRRS